MTPTNPKELSPFNYGSTVSQVAFTNRKSEVKKLYSNLMSGINTMLISPRRWGKSSLVEHVILDINKSHTNTKTVIIDLFATSTEEEFLELFTKEVVKASSSKWQEWMTAGKTFFKHIIPKISVGADPYTEFSMSFDWKDIHKHKVEILNLPEVIGKQKQIKFIICLDEFQNLANLANFEEIEKKMRSAWQKHKNVTYCLYGSKRHMMTDIFNNPSKPFYRFGDIMHLSKISTEHWVSFIVENFRKTEKSISKTNAKKIAISMKNHSWYVQQLAHYTWQQTKNKVTIRIINAALNELINANYPLYQREVEIISPTQLGLLKAITQGERQLTSVNVMQHYRLGTPRNVTKNKIALNKTDLIHKEKDMLEFLDPVFELWFRKTYFNKSYYIQ